MSNQNLNQTLNQTSNNTLGIAYTIDSISALPTTFHPDSFLLFTNFHIYVMRKDSTEYDFLTLYTAVNGFFVLFALLLYSFSGKIFEAQKSGDVKETTQIIIKVASTLMCISIHLLAIPTLSLLLQGFECADLQLTSPIECGSLSNHLLILSSSLLLPLYLTFIYL